MNDWFLYGLIILIYGGYGLSIGFCIMYLLRMDKLWKKDKSKARKSKKIESKYIEPDPPKYSGVLSKKLNIPPPEPFITERGDAYKYILKHGSGYTEDLYKIIHPDIIRDMINVGYINVG